ncbi:MAG: DUF2292 domain-containing protein [Methylococcaceae bacterium]
MAADMKKYSEEQSLTDIAQQIIAALQLICPGSVEIIIHDNKVVQISRDNILQE